jgi:hypothetical protein
MRKHEARRLASVSCELTWGRPFLGAASAGACSEAAPSVLDFFILRRKSNPALQAASCPPFAKDAKSGAPTS